MKATLILIQEYPHIVVYASGSGMVTLPVYRRLQRAGVMKLINVTAGTGAKVYNAASFVC